MPRELDLDLQGLPIGRGEQVERHAVWVEGRIPLLLPAVGVQVLTEVALPVEQSDGDQRDAEVAGGLQMVAGQNAEAARIDRDRFADAELGREVSDRVAAGGCPWNQRGLPMYRSRSSVTASRNAMNGSSSTS